MDYPCIMSERNGGDKKLTETEKEQFGDKCVHRFWRRVTECVFDVQITDSDAAKNRGGGTKQDPVEEQER